MQEDIENRTLTLGINATKMTGRALAMAMRKFLAWKNTNKIPHGKQSMKQLANQNQGLTNIEITDSNIKSFEKVARKYSVDFALKKDNSISPPKYLVFFKGKDTDAITSAFSEYSANQIKKAKKPSVVEEIKKKPDIVQDVVSKVKDKNKEIIR